MSLRRIFSIALLATAGLRAAERVTAYRAQLNGSSGPVNGVLVTVGDQMVFVDSDRPDLSFAIPRTDVRSITLLGNGMVTARVSPPYSGLYGESSDFRIRMVDPASAETIVRWIGVPVTAVAPRTDTTDIVVQQPGAVAFDVRHDNDNGRLIVTNSGLEFVDISNRSHSRSWSYGELKGVTREGGNEIVIHPYHGDEFHMKTAQALDTALYSTIADRIVAARPR